MNLLCRLNRLPRFLRLAASGLLLTAGAPLLFTPFPGGIVLVAAGGMLLYCAYPPLRSRISRWLLRRPKTAARLAPFLAACDRCPRKTRR
jgi:hypothetical protein